MSDTSSSDTSSNLPAVRRDMTEACVLDPDDQAALEHAYRTLEHPSVTARITDAVGRRLGSLNRFLPVGVSGVVAAAANRAIQTALSVALQSLDETRPRNGLAALVARRITAGNTRAFHKVAAAASGAAGGAFGLASLPVELPISTVIILRSIADIARAEGEDLSEREAALACLEVFALGAHGQDDHLAEGGYFAIRAMLARTVSEAGKYIAAQGLANEVAAPVLVRLASQIGSRFGLVVSEKLAAQAMPVVGAIGGAAVNYAFAEHFQSLASGHFTVRRLERRYGRAIVRAAYERLRGAEQAAA